MDGFQVVVILIGIFLIGMLLGLLVATDEIRSKTRHLEPYKLVVNGQDTTYYFIQK